MLVVDLVFLENPMNYSIGTNNLGHGRLATLR